MTEPYLFRAYYNDGEILDEAPGVGFGHIDQPRLVALELVPQWAGLPQPHLAVSEGLRPIFFRRRKINVSSATGEQERLPVITVLGWQRTVNGTNVKSLVAFFEDGSALITDDDGAF
jgi:hypothetical protein